MWTNRLSVVISVHNGAHHLARCLPSLAAQRSDIHELIVVDDGSTDATSAVAREGDAIVVTLPERRGICAARNAGAARASGEVIAFVDADTLVLPGWAAALREAFTAGIALVGGAIKSPEARTLAERYRADKPQHDEWGRRGFLPYSAGSNLAIRRDVFEAIDGFDELLPGAEDADLCFRAQLAGHRLSFSPEAALIHFPRPTVPALLHQQLRHERARFAVAAVGEAGRALAKLLDGVPVVAVGAGYPNGNQVALRVTRADLLRGRQTLSSRLMELLAG